MGEDVNLRRMAKIDTCDEPIWTGLSLAKYLKGGKAMPQWGDGDDRQQSHDCGLRDVWRAI